MFQGYTEFECIKKMSADYKKRFENIAEHYAEKLNNVVGDGGSVFTLHDFDHHCCNLYKIVSDVILIKENAFKNDGIGFNERELYILNLAILLHDLGMTKKVESTRKHHSVTSVKMVLEDYKNSSNPLSDGKSGLSSTDIDALTLIIQAHSDVKDGIIPDDKNGFNNEELTNTMPGRVGVTRARFIANILRLADELDITSDRLGSLDVKCELEEAIKNKCILDKRLEGCTDEKIKKEIEAEIERCDAAAESNRHWRNLSLFKVVDRDKTGKVTLRIKDTTVEAELSIGEDPEELAHGVLDVYEKIKGEFDRFDKEIKSDLKFDSMVAIKEVTYLSNEPRLNAAIEKIKKKIKIENTITENIIQPSVISTDIEKKITEFVEKRDLYDVGHYKLHDNLCARDWIIADEIILTETFFKKCETQFLLHIKEKMKLCDDYIIIGIDFCGMLAASRLAFILHKPYTYVVPEFKKMESSIKELECTIKEFNNVIIIADVIVTFSTIKNLIQDLKLNNKVKAVYGVLFRDTDDSRYVKESQELAKITYVLNSAFNIEVQENDRCRYKDCESCKASNKTFN